MIIQKRLTFLLGHPVGLFVWIRKSDC